MQDPLKCIKCYMMHCKGQKEYLYTLFNVVTFILHCSYSTVAFLLYKKLYVIA